MPITLPRKAAMAAVVLLGLGYLAVANTPSGLTLSSKMSVDKGAVASEVADRQIVSPVGRQTVWSDVASGSGRQPTIVIDDAVYPDSAGVQFLVNGEIDDRNSGARPNGYDATGPQEDSKYHVYPDIALQAGDVITARWTDRNGTNQANDVTVDASTTSGQDPTPTPDPSPTPDPTPVGDVTPGPVSGAPDDGLNPPYDGSRGIAPSSPYAIPNGFPTPQTTGVPAGITLTPSDGLVITQAGTVIDGLDINGNVEVRADNVTIKNSRITSGGNTIVKIHKDSTGRTYSGFVIEDSRIRGVGECNSTIGHSNYTARRVHISGCHDGAKMFGNTTIVDSYLAGFYRINGVTHNDAIQGQGGSNIIVRHNTVLGPYKNSNAAIIFQTKQSALSNVLVENNYLSGGAYTAMIHENDNSASNVVVRNNVFETNSSLYGWKASTTGSYSGNILYDPTI